MKWPRDWTLVELVIALAILLIIIAVVFNSCARFMCKNGEDVRDSDGSMNCWGSESFKHCEPSTHFVCHD